MPSSSKVLRFEKLPFEAFRLRALLLLLILLLSWQSPLFAQFEEDEEPKDERLILYKLQNLPRDSRNELVLSFDKDFVRPTSFLYETGLLQVILPKTKFVKELAHTRINDGFIKEIRLIPMGNNSILEVQFADSDFKPEGKVLDEAQFEFLRIFIHKKPLAAAKPKQESQSPFPLKEGTEQTEPISSTAAIVQMLVALILVLGLLYLLVWIYNRYFLKRLNLNKGKYQIRMTNSIHLSNKQKIAIVEVNGMAFAVGISPGQMTLIGELEKKGATEQLRKLGGKESIDFAAIRADYQLEQRQNAEERTLPTENFKDELIQKIKRMKPID